MSGIGGRHQTVIYTARLYVPSLDRLLFQRFTGYHAHGPRCHFWPAVCWFPFSRPRRRHCEANSTPPEVIRTLTSPCACMPTHPCAYCCCPRPFSHGKHACNLYQRRLVTYFCVLGWSLGGDGDAAGVGMASGHSSNSSRSLSAASISFS